MDITRIIERIQKPVRVTEISTGILHSRRLRFHSDTSLSALDMQSYMYDFLHWVGGDEQTSGLITADKFDTFKQLITYPLPTSELLESIYKNLKRVFDGKNAVERYQFETKELEADFKEFFDSQHFKMQAFEAMQTMIDSVMVVDMPEQQNGKYPEPYYYFIDMENVVDIEVNSKNELKFIVFKSGDKYVAICDEYWRVLSGDKDKLVLETEVEHGLGYAPARMLWTDKIAGGNYINHRSPVTNSLGNLDWLLFHKISKRHLDLYASYPIYITYKEDDVKKTGQPEERTQGKGKKKIMGAGSKLSVPAPISKEDPDLMANPVKVIPAEITSLDYNVGEDERLTDLIFKSCVGYDGEPSNDQAKNEKQVKSSFESRKDILMDLKRNFEISHEWLAETIGELRYRQIMDAEIDYGTEFYLQNEEQVLADLNTAKTNKAPEAVIEDLNQMFFDTKYRTDSESAERVKICNDLDPYPLKSVEEVMTYFDKGLISKETMLIKLNLTSYLKRFERENVPLLQFAEGADYGRKIETIYQTLIKYAKEDKASTDGSGEQQTGSVNTKGNGTPDSFEGDEIGGSGRTEPTGSDSE